ncbi:hypothetical protein [Tolumonas osonensis]|uniref:DUF4239 domain-containing protein n=1 Tax=Tolumonas osonensis TaxID=675874 RepID=A0A841GEQ0_9GAMM|nr:hypothetical protein [Tolumonas osonensis]MBB6055106.1 hypothetical protein [Tolumonas osonensis]
MIFFKDYPFIVFIISFFLLWFSALFGAFVLRKWRAPDTVTREDFSIVQASTLSLLALLIGFSFSMSIGRYDQRKNYEKEETNAIGTEYLRAELLPANETVKLKAMLKDYLDLRILFYTTSNKQELQQINKRTAALQADMWAVVREPAKAQPSPIGSLTVSGMNDVLNSQRHTQAAWLNRIPIAATVLMTLIAMFGNAMLGYSSRSPESERRLFLLLPVIVSIAFLLIMDIDSPSWGIIRVVPDNLISLAESLRGQ